MAGGVGGEEEGKEEEEEQEKEEEDLFNRLSISRCYEEKLLIITLAGAKLLTFPSVGCSREVYRVFEP